MCFAFASGGWLAWLTSHSELGMGIGDTWGGRCVVVVVGLWSWRLFPEHWKGKKKPTRIQTENEESDPSRLPIHDNGTEAETPDSVFSWISLGLFVNLNLNLSDNRISEDAQPIRTRVKSISISNRPHRHAEPKTLALYSILYTLYSSLRRDPRLLKWLLHIKRWRLLHIHKENKVT